MAKGKIKLASEKAGAPVMVFPELHDPHNSHVIEFKIGQTVYLKADMEQRPRMVTGISLRPNNMVSYAIVEGSVETWHYNIEISAERDIIKATSN